MNFGKKRTDKSSLTGTLFQLPSFLILTVAVFLPSVWAVFLSMTNYSIAGTDYRNLQFVFLNNYVRLLTDQEFTSSLVITIEFAVITTLAEVSLSLVLAVLTKGLNRILQQTCYLVMLAGTILPLSVSIYMLINVFHFKYGILAQIPFLPAVGWFSNYAFLTVVICEIWVNVGWIFFLYATVIDGMPNHFLELSEVDSLGIVQRIRHVYFPQMKGTVYMTLLFGLINGLQSFIIILSLTNGGPRDSTQVIGLFAYKQAFRLFDFGYGATINLVLFLLIVILLIPLNKSIGIFGNSEGGFDGELQKDSQ